MNRTAGKTAASRDCHGTGDGMSLTRKQQLFVEAYTGEARGNATEAARLAGYKGNDNTLHVVGAENLQKPTIIEAIEKHDEDHPAVMDATELRAFWSTVARGGDTLAADGEPPMPSHMRDRLKASEMLAKSSAMFVTRVEQTGAGGGPISVKYAKEVKDMTDEELARELTGGG